MICKPLVKFFREFKKHLKLCEACDRADRRWKERGERQPLHVSRRGRRGGGAPSNFTGD